MTFFAGASALYIRLYARSIDARAAHMVAIDLAAGNHTKREACAALASRLRHPTGGCGDLAVHMRLTYDDVARVLEGTALGGAEGDGAMVVVRRNAQYGFAKCQPDGCVE